MKKQITGFKAFNNDILESLGKNNEGKIIINKDDIKEYKTGIYLCENIEDTLRYVNNENDVHIAKVRGYGNIHKYEDYNYDFYDTYSVDTIEIIKFLNRKEILNEVLKHKYNDFRIQRFITLYKLTDEEIYTLRKECQGVIKNLDKYIEYYQYGQEDAFTRKRK